MMKYDGYIIKTEPDYKSVINSGKEIDEIFCEVYDEYDTEFKNCLGDFNMQRGFEFQDNTVIDIEKGIKKLVDSDWAYYQFEKKEAVFKRTEELFYRLLNHMKITMGDGDAELMLQKEIGMTESEVKNAFSQLDTEQAEADVSQGMDLK